MEILIKCAAIALVSAACALVIKSKNPEFSFILSIVCASSVCFAALGMISELKDFVSELVNGTGLSSAVFMPVVKCVGIAIVTKLISELCRDAGQNGTSTAVEYLGSAAAVYTALPVMQSMIKTLEVLT